jgi:hypothetical protein
MFWQMALQAGALGCPTASAGNTPLGVGHA